MRDPLFRTVAVAGLAFAAGAFLLAWLRAQQAVGALSAELHLAVVAALFAAGGLGLGWSVAARRHGPVFVRNDAAVAALGLTGQEMRVLAVLASGRPNKQIARDLGLSPNTVKTHLANLFAKLGAATRTEAVSRARDLGVIP